MLIAAAAMTSGPGGYHADRRAAVFQGSAHSPLRREARPATGLRQVGETLLDVAAHAHIEVARPGRFPFFT